MDFGIFLSVLLAIATARALEWVTVAFVRYVQSWIVYKINSKNETADDQ